MLFAGSLLLYLESYKKILFISSIGFILIVFGWGTIFMQIIEGTILDAKKIPFNQNRVKSLRQVVAKFFAYPIFVAIMCGNVFYILHLADNRRDEILQNGVTKITVAEVSGIETNHSRSGTHYYAIFVYKTEDGQSIRYSWSENEGDFVSGEKYEIKYAVEYPEMFKIIREVQ